MAAMIAAPIKAERGRRIIGDVGNRTMMITAAKPAPFVTPITSGEANGLRRIPCRIVQLLLVQLLR